MTASNVAPGGGPVGEQSAHAMHVLARDLGLDVEDDVLALLEPAYVEAYASLSRAARRRNALSEVERELVLLAVNASVHLFDDRGVRLHAARALAAGATPGQVLGTKAEALGTHTISSSVPILLEELAAAGQEVRVPQDGDLTEAETAVKDRLTRLRGWWHEPWRPMLRLDPEFLLATHEFLAVGQEVLEPRLRELIYTAFDVATTHLYPAGARAHIRNALQKGSSAEEILEVFELVALIGYQSLLLVLPAVRDALAAADDETANGGTA